MALEGREVTSANLWGYVPLEATEEDEILRDYSHEAFEKLVRDGRMWVAALSMEQHREVGLCRRTETT